MDAAALRALAERVRRQRRWWWLSRGGRWDWFAAVRRRRERDRWLGVLRNGLRARAAQGEDHE